MKTWQIIIELKNESKIFDRECKNVDDEIEKLKKEYPNYRAIIYKVKE